MFVYPLIAMIMLIIVYIVKTPTITIIGGFVVGYSAAGAITKAYSVNGPKYVLLLNIGITFVGVLLALYVNMSYSKAMAKVNYSKAVLE